MSTLGRGSGVVSVRTGATAGVVPGAVSGTPERERARCAASPSCSRTFESLWQRVWSSQRETRPSPSTSSFRKSSPQAIELMQRGSCSGRSRGAPSSMSELLNGIEDAWTPRSDSLHGVVAGGSALPGAPPLHMALSSPTVRSIDMSCSRMM